MTEIKSLLNEAADEAKLYDVVEPALSGGRRLRRVRHALVGGGAFAAFLAIVAGATLPQLTRSAAPATSAAPTRTASAPAVPTSCNAQMLPSPGKASWTEVTGADRTGRFVVGRSTTQGTDERQVIIWDHGVAIPVSFPGLDQRFEDINALGEAVGFSMETDFGGRSYLYADGVLTKLPGDAPGVFALAGAINDRGVIVGYIDIEQVPGQTRLPPRRFPDGRIPNAENSPVVWRTRSGQPEWLPMPPRSLSGSAAGIDEDGTIAGTVDFDDGVASQPPTQAVAWLPDGTLVPLAEPIMVDGQPATRTMTHGIRDGWVYGSASGAKDSVTFLWNPHTGEVRAPALPRGTVMDMNASGWIAAVVPIGDPGSASYEDVAVLVAGAVQLELPSVFANEQGARHMAVLSISEDGTVLAGVDSRAGNTAAVLWTCR
jgi:hypothetical protein